LVNSAMNHQLISTVRYNFPFKEDQGLALW
jgi:hypothetical protein